MPCSQRRRIPSIIRAVSPCFTPPCIARRRERSRPPMPPSTPRGHHFVSDTSTHLTLPRANPPSCTTCWVRDGSAGNAGRPSWGLTFSIIFMWWLAAWKVYVVSPLCLVPLLFFFFTPIFFVYIFHLKLFYESRRLLRHKFVTYLSIK